MKLLDRYMVRQLLKLFVMGLAMFITVLVCGQYLIKITRYVAMGAPFLPVAELFGLRILTVSVFCMPMAMLVAALLAVLRLSGDSELTAIQASGVPFYRVAMPFFGFGLAVSVGTLALNELVVPPAERAAARMTDSIEAAVQNELVRTVGGSKAFVVQDFDGTQLNRIVIARQFDPLAGKMQGVLFIQFEDGRPKAVVEAREAEWIDKNQWRFKDARTTALGPIAEGHHVLMESPSTIVTLDKTPEDIKRETKDPDSFTYVELRDYIATLRKQKMSPRMIMRMEMALQNKISMPFAALVFAVIGTALGVRRARSNNVFGVALSLVVIFFYYCLWHSISILGENGQVSPFVAAWFANAIGLIVGVGMVLRASR